MLQYCICTVLSQLLITEGKPSKVFLVGTHRDLEGSSSESQEKNTKLIDMLYPSFRDCLVFYHPFSEVTFSVNVKNPVIQDHEVYVHGSHASEDKTSSL